MLLRVLRWFFVFSMVATASLSASAGDLDGLEIDVIEPGESPGDAVSRIQLPVELGPKPDVNGQIDNAPDAGLEAAEGSRDAKGSLVTQNPEPEPEPPEETDDSHGSGLLDLIEPIVDPILPSRQ